MKKWIAVLALLITLWGCDKGSSVVPIVEQPVPTVKLSISPEGGVLPYGEKITISWSAVNAKTATLNGDPVGLSGSKTVQLFQTTTYSLRGVSGNLSDNDNKNVPVGDWKTSTLGLFVGKQFGGLKSTKYYSMDGTYLYDYSVSEGQKNFYMNFTSSNGELKGQLKHDTGVISNWEYKSDGTLVMGDNYKLVSLTPTELVVSLVVTSNGESKIRQLTYWRE